MLFSCEIKQLVVQMLKLSSLRVSINISFTYAYVLKSNISTTLGKNELHNVL